MKISMKYWKIGAYFGSIALAVGIGMFQATAKEGGMIGATDCNSSGTIAQNCSSLGGPSYCTGHYVSNLSGVGSSNIILAKFKPDACLVIQKDEAGEPVLDEDGNPIILCPGISTVDSTSSECTTPGT